MAGLPRFVTETLPEVSRTFGQAEPRLDRGHRGDALIACAVFLMLVSLLTTLIPGNAFLRAGMGAALAWGFAEIFTRHRGLAAPSVVFSLVFAEMILIGGVALIPGIPLRDAVPDLVAAVQNRPAAVSLVCVALGAAMLAHYRLLRAPIDPALAAAAWTASVMLAGRAWLPDLITYAGHFVAAICAWMTLCAATLMDISDPRRETRNSDVAFWLHVVSALTLAYAIFACTGVLKEVTAFLALSLFAVLGMAVNRYVILTLTKFILVVVLAIAIAGQSAQLAVLTLIPLVILGFAHLERHRIRRRLLERTLPEIAPHLPPIEDDEG